MGAVLRDMRAMSNVFDPQIEPVRAYAPLEMTSEPPWRPEPRRRGPGKKTLARRQRGEVVRPQVTRPLMPKPLKIIGAEVLCQLRGKTLLLPLQSDKLLLTGGLKATISRIADGEFHGLAVSAIVQLPNKERAAGLKRKRRKGD